MMYAEKKGLKLYRRHTRQGLLTLARCKSSALIPLYDEPAEGRIAVECWTDGQCYYSGAVQTEVVLVLSPAGAGSPAATNQKG